MCGSIGGGNSAWADAWNTYGFVKALAKTGQSAKATAVPKFPGPGPGPDPPPQAASPPDASGPSDQFRRNRNRQILASIQGPPTTSVGSLLGG